MDESGFIVVDPGKWILKEDNVLILIRLIIS